MYSCSDRHRLHLKIFLDRSVAMLDMTRERRSQPKKMCSRTTEIVTASCVETTWYRDRDQMKPGPATPSGKYEDFALGYSTPSLGECSKKLGASRPDVGEGPPLVLTEHAMMWLTRTDILCRSQIRQVVGDLETSTGSLRINLSCPRCASWRIRAANTSYHGGPC